MQLRSQRKKQINTNDLIFKVKPEIRSLTTHQKNLYSILNTFEFQMSRLYQIPMFQDLVNEIMLFNRQLEDWRNDKCKIKNLVTTYHLYENLYSRLKYLCNFSKKEQDSISGTQQIVQWFFTQKPKIRCLVKETKASMAAYTPDQKEDIKIEMMVLNNQLKREMQPYDMMSRTAHSQFFPPKQQLKQYKRKHFLPFEEEKPSQNPFTAKKSTSASILSKNRLAKFRQSVGTLMTTNTMNQTKSSFKNTVTQFRIQQNTEQKKQVENIDKVKIQDENAIQLNQDEKDLEKQQVLDEMQRQKQVKQEDILLINIQQNLGQEDDPDQDVVYDDQQIYPTGIKIYRNDHDQEQLRIAEELAKQVQQSTLRKVMGINQEKIRSKLDDLDLKRNMENWAKIKGKNSTSIARKLETNHHMNKFKELEHQKKQNLLTKEQAKQFQKGQKKHFNATTGFKGFKQTKEIEKKNPKNIIPMLHRSKSSYPGSIQSEIKKLKIQEAMKIYGKYINHIPVQIQNTQNPDETITNNLVTSDSPLRKQTESTNFRSTSLTSFASNATKKKGLSTLLRQHDAIKYNQISDAELFNIKKKLSGKMVPAQIANLYKAMSIVPQQQTIPGVGLYTSGRDLLSNPFFPKTNASSKKKKKGK